MTADWCGKPLPETTCALPPGHEGPCYSSMEASLVAKIESLLRPRVETRASPGVPSVEECERIAYQRGRRDGSKEARPPREEIERLIDDYGRRCAAHGWACEHRRRTALLSALGYGDEKGDAP